MGCGEAAGKPSLEEDLRTSTKGGLSRAGISSHATMRHGVNQPCGIRGSWGCGPALPSVVTRARRRQPGRVQRDLEDGGRGPGRGAGPLLPPPRRRRRCTGMGYLQPCAGSGRRGRRRGRRPSPWTGPGRSLAERERAAGGRQDRRGLDEDRDGSTLPTPPVLREGHSEPAIDAWGTESKRGWAGQNGRS